MFWGKKTAKEERKLLGPKEIPEVVQKYLAAERKMDPDLVKLLRAVERKKYNRNDQYSDFRRVGSKGKEGPGQRLRFS